jgi:polyphosphate kinase
MSNEKVILTIPEFSPFQSAYLEIGSLAGRPELHKIIVVGPRQLTTEEEAENVRRNLAYRVALIAIVKKHGVAAEYAQLLESKIHEKLKVIEWLGDGNELYQDFTTTLSK